MILEACLTLVRVGPPHSAYPEAARLYRVDALGERGLLRLGGQLQHLQVEAEQISHGLRRHGGTSDHKTVLGRPREAKRLMYLNEGHVK